MATITVGTNPLQIAIKPDGDSAWVSNFLSGYVSVIDIATNSVANNSSLTPKVHYVIFSPDGKRAYVGNAENISVIDTPTKAVLSTTKMTSQIQALAITPDGHFLYVPATNGSVYNSISVIDTASTPVVVTIPDDNGPGELTMSPDGTRVYVSDGLHPP